MNTRRRLTSPLRAALRALAPFALVFALAAAFVLVSGAIAAYAAYTAPPVISVSIAGSPLSPSGTATATVKVVSGRKSTFAYTWQVNHSATRTVTSTTATSDKFSLAGLSYGDVVSVIVTPDGTSASGAYAGTPADASVTLVDHAPTAKVALKVSAGTATAPRPTGTATATATPADIDGDAVKLTYVWTVDGKEQKTTQGTSATSDSFSYSNLNDGQVVAVTVTPTDGTMDGTPATVSGTIAEDAPTATVAISGTLTPLGTATASARFSDPNGDAVKATYEWRINGDVVRTVQNTTATSDKLVLSPYKYGDAISVTVTPSDPWLTGAAGRDQDVMVDTPPTAKLLGFKQIAPAAGAPTPSSSAPWRPAGAATVGASVSDTNKDPKLTVIYTWKINGVIKQTHQLPTGSYDNFSWSGLNDGDVISVTSTPNDGTMDGTPLTNTATVVEHLPTATVTLGGDARPGGLATAKVTFADADRDPVKLTYVWSINGAVEKIDTGITTTDYKFAVPRNAPRGKEICVRVIPNDTFYNGAVVSDTGSTGVAAAGLNTGYNPADDDYSMFDTTLFTGAQDWWDAGFTGKGVTVAVIDTGVSPVPALSGSDKVINGPDLSLDSQNPNLAHLDSNGHGTFMAGLIAGHDPSLTTPYSAAPASLYRGMAPDAQILNVKVGATDGEVDVTQVIAAIDWIVQHRHDNNMDVRVISLSYGTNSTQSYLYDPLAYAAEQAWKAGIVVVAAAGNTGFQQGAGAPGVADPAMDPFVIAVGGVDTMGTYGNDDDLIGDYSASSAGCGTPDCKGPDILAAGSHLQGLRVPGSFIDLNHPEGKLSDLYFRGSGTSQATALAAGSIALILEKYPKMTPDDVKAFLQGGADKIAGVPDNAQGAGEIDLSGLLDDAAPSNSSQPYTDSVGTGTIEGARGSDHLAWGNSGNGAGSGVILKGEQDIFGHAVDTTSLAAAEASHSSWYQGTWNGNTWSGNSWSGNSWSGNSWSGNSWSGNTWSGNTWSGNSWSGNTWSGNSWSGADWS